MAYNQIDMNDRRRIFASRDETLNPSDHIRRTTRVATLDESQSSLQLAAMCIMYDSRPGQHEFEDICGVTLRPGKTLRDAYTVRSRVLAQIGGDAQNEVVILGSFLGEVFETLRRCS